MDREIKFRAWDKDKEKMLSWKQIIHNTSNNLFGGLFELFRRLERFKALQFTGLKDKNGKEIYEGDIVNIAEISSCACCKIKDREIGIVCFKEFTFYDGEYTHTVIGYCVDYGDVDGDCKEINSDCYIIEVIGNIYENKKLLNK